MVEPPKGIGPLQGLISGTRVSEPQPAKRDGETKPASETKDEVTLSPQALSQSQAEEASGQVRVALEDNTDLTLGSGQNFDESL